MKKYLSRITTFLLVTLSISTITLAAQQYTIYVNGNKLDGKVIVQDGTTYVPLRAVTEALGCNVDVKNGVISVSNTTSSVPTPMIETPQTTSSNKPSEPVSPPIVQPPSNSNVLSQQEMLDCFNQMIKKSSTGTGAYVGKTVKIVDVTYLSQNKMIVEFTIEDAYKIVTRKNEFLFTDIEAARVFMNGGLLNGYCGFQSSNISRTEINKPQGKPVEPYIQDGNGMWIVNPDY